MFLYFAILSSSASLHLTKIPGETEDVHMFGACIVRSIPYCSGSNWKMGKHMLAGSFALWSLRYLD